MMTFLNNKPQIGGVIYVVHHIQPYDLERLVELFVLIDGVAPDWLTILFKSSPHYEPVED